MVGKDITFYQVDLLQLGWENRWDLAFMLDVLEHIPDDVEVLRQTAAALPRAVFYSLPYPPCVSFGAITTRLPIMSAGIIGPISHVWPDSPASSFAMPATSCFS